MPGGSSILSRPKCKSRPKYCADCGRVVEEELAIFENRQHAEIGCHARDEKRLAAAFLGEAEVPFIEQRPDERERRADAEAKRKQFHAGLKKIGPAKIGMIEIAQCVSIRSMVFLQQRPIESEAKQRTEDENRAQPPAFPPGEFFARDTERTGIVDARTYQQQNQKPHIQPRIKDEAGNEQHVVLCAAPAAATAASPRASAAKTQAFERASVSVLLRVLALICHSMLASGPFPDPTQCYTSHGRLHSDGYDRHSRIQ